MATSLKPATRFGPIMNIAFLASHRGSNMQAIIGACASGALAAKPAVLVSNNRGAEALERARRHGVTVYVLNAATHTEPDQLDLAILDALLAHQTDLVVLAGYMKKIGPRVLAAFAGRIINIHPALLPKFGGQGMYGAHVHRAVLAAHETVTGASVHLVDEEYDHGRVLAQAEVPVLADDTVETLAARVLAREHEVLISTLRRITRGELKL
jgi:phosphoribosylglycinamide formyltransferase-1